MRPGKGAAIERGSRWLPRDLRIPEEDRKGSNNL